MVYVLVETVFVTSTTIMSGLIALMPKNAAGLSVKDIGVPGRRYPHQQKTLDKAGGV